MNNTPTPNTSIITFFKNVIAFQMRYPWQLLALILSIFATVAFDCFIPVVFKWLFNTVLYSKNIKLLLDAAVVLGLSFITIAASIMLQIITMAKMGTNLVGDLRLAAFKKIQQVDLNDKNETYESDIISRFTNDLTLIEYTSIFTLWPTIRSVIMCIIGGCFLIYFDWLMSVFAIILIPISLIIPRFFSRSSDKELEQKKHLESSLLADVQENISMQDVIRSLLLRKYKSEYFEKKLQLATDISYRYNIGAGFIVRTAFLGVTLTKIIILCVGIYLVMNGHLTAGGLIGFILLLDNVNNALTAVVNTMPMLQRGAASLNNIQQLLAEEVIQPPSNLQEIPRLSQAIHFNDIYFKRGDKTILADINLAISAGQFVAFVGPSGAGKSTVLKLLLQEYTANSGNLLFDDVDISTISSQSLLSQTGIVMQQPKLFETSIKENIRMGKLDATDAEIINAAKQADIHQDIMQLPAQYDTPIGKRNNGLSGGQAQRVAIARALISKPAILCLDEATSALDPISGAAIEDTLTKLKHAHTTIAITHRLSSAIKADRIFVLDHGKIVESGTHQQLLNNNNLYKKLWDKQQGFTFTADATDAYVDPQWLKHIPLFTALDDLTLKNLANEFVLERFETDNVVITRSDPGDKFYILVAGTVEIIKPDKDGHEQVIAKLIDGDFFGEIALLHDTPRTATVKTIGTCMFLTLHRQQFHLIFQRLPKDTQNLLLTKAKERQT